MQSARKEDYKGDKKEEMMEEGTGNRRRYHNIRKTKMWRR
jgi:hypothetical protein